MNILKQAVIGLVEHKVLKTGRVIGVRYWAPENFVELDLHLPGVDMSSWDHAQHIKCRVGTLTFRDYTPAGWDAETQTVTLYIDAAHTGPGTVWAKTVKEGDVFSYAGISRSPDPPAPLARLVCLGDESSLGHFLALQQLLPRSSSLSGAIVLGEEGHRKSFPDYFHLPMAPLPRKGSAVGTLGDWIEGEGSFEEDDVFYVVGNVQLVQGVRKTLREKGVARDRIKAQGFWR
jgi:NADPH-dependent ferric siderophore reductase